MPLRRSSQDNLAPGDYRGFDSLLFLMGWSVLVILAVGCRRHSLDDLWQIATKAPLTQPSRETLQLLAPTNTPIRRPPTRAAYRRPRNARPIQNVPLARPSQFLDGPMTDSAFGHSVSGAGDVDGDGFDDLLVGAFNGGTNGSGEVHLYRGSAQGVIPTPWWSFPCTHAGAEFGHQVEGVGDVNGDGFADFVVGATSFSADDRPSKTGAAFVFLGGPKGPRLAPGWPVVGDVSESKDGFTVAAAGDVNGDGYDDILVGAWNSPISSEKNAARVGRVFLFLGGPNGPSTNAFWSPAGERIGAQFGYSVHGAGDLNGDGYADIVIGSHGYENAWKNAGRVYVYYGGPHGPSQNPDWTLTGTQTDQVTGNSVFTAGDVNGDGFDDLIVGANATSHPERYEGVVLGFYGSSNGLPGHISWSFEPDEPGMFFGHSVATAGDLNHDGFDDIVISAADGQQELPGEGVAFVFHGSRTGLSRRPDWMFRGGQAASAYGATVRGAGDLNGDGFDDIVVGQPRYSGDIPRQGRTWIHFGSAYALRESSQLYPRFPTDLKWTLIIGGACALVSFAGSRMFYLRRAAAAAAAARLREEVQLEERRRISRDLHDQLGAELTEIAIVSASALCRPEAAALKLEQIKSAAGRLVENLAELVWVTKPSNDRLDSLADYLADMATSLLSRAEFACSLDIPMDLQKRHLGYELRHDLVLVVKEALHNAIKHSGGSKVTLGLACSGDELRFWVRDDGAWKEPKRGAGRGNGLQHLTERLRRHGGALSVERSQTGTTIGVVAPLPPQSVISSNV